MEQNYNRLLKSVTETEKQQIEHIVHNFAIYMSEVMLSDAVNEEHRTKICEDVRTLQKLYDKYDIPFPWQADFEREYDYEDFIGKFMYDVYNRTVLKRQIVAQLKRSV
ncbi:MAG: hypothetical protein ACI32N_07805 [Bulleidia sp.]